MTNLISANRIALIFSKRIGDVIFCTPTIQLLREHKPSTTIDAFALSEQSVEVLKFNPALNQVYLAQNFPANKLQENYDIVIALHTSSDIQEYLTNINAIFCERVPNDKHWSYYVYQFMANHLGLTSYDPNPPYYSLYPQTQHDLQCEQLLKDNGLSTDQEHISLIGFHMGCSRMARYGLNFWKRLFGYKLTAKGSKCWPFSNFVKLAELLHAENPNIRIILTGSPSEDFLGKFFLGKKYVINLIGKTSVLEMAALMKRFSVFVTGDTGPLHIASAMQTPLVALFGITDPIVTGPRTQGKYQLLYDKRGMEQISLESVAEAVKNLAKQHANPNQLPA